MFCSLAHFTMISDQNFFAEITGKYKFFNSKILFLFNDIDPFICRSVAAFVFVVMNYRYQTLY